uniref:C2H2-type domain-containing protein n=1 Tax=Steinernema glaseri TaxID=37863 RepID=A0A1I7YSE2_9BILA
MLYQAAFLAQIQQQQQIKIVDDTVPSAALSPSSSASSSADSSESSRKRVLKPDLHEGTVAKKAKTVKRTHLDDAETNSPVSGMLIKLAQHKCPRIAYEAYKCPECDKVFSCPANLASHRRWHKPRSETQQSCPTCEQKFDSKKQLKAHHCVLQDSPSCPTCEQKFDSKKQLKAHHCVLQDSPAIASLLFS